MNGELELKFDGVKLKIDGWRGVVSLLGMSMLAAAVVREIRLPREQRTWHGTLLGFVPYDLRPPTLDRLVHTLWNPRQDAVIVPTVFGVGWTVNAAALVRVFGGGAGEVSGDAT